MNLTRWKHVSYIFMIDYMHHNNLTGTFLRRADIILQKTTTNRQKGQNIKNRFRSFQKIHFQEDALISSRNCAYFNLFRNVYSRNISQFKSPLTPCFFFFSLILWQELCHCGICFVLPAFAFAISCVPCGPLLPLWKIIGLQCVRCCLQVLHISSFF